MVTDRRWVDSIYVFGRYISPCEDYSLCEDSPKLQPWTANHHSIVSTGEENTWMKNNPFVRNNPFVHEVCGSCRGSCCCGAGRELCRASCAGRAQVLPLFVEWQWGDPTSSALLRQVHRKSVTNSPIICLPFCCSEDAPCWREKERRESFPGLLN